MIAPAANCLEPYLFKSKTADDARKGETCAFMSATDGQAPARDLATVGRCGRTALPLSNEAPTPCLNLEASSTFQQNSAFGAAKFKSITASTTEAAPQPAKDGAIFQVTKEQSPAKKTSVLGKRKRA